MYNIQEWGAYNHFMHKILLKIWSYKLNGHSSIEYIYKNYANGES